MKKNLDRQTMCNILSMIAKSRKFSQYASSRLKKNADNKALQIYSSGRMEGTYFQKKKNVIKKNQKVDKLVLHLGI